MRGGALACMKGFPNQVADLGKLATGMACLARLVNAGANAKDDGVFGPELVRVGVAGTGHTPLPLEDYIREQLRKKPSNQSFRATARGLRELYRLMHFIDDSEAVIEITELGRQAVDFAGAPMDTRQIEFWRRVISNISHGDEHGNVSHPYQVLLHLVARKPGIKRAKCALALEARNDLPEELERIASLSDLDENQIRIGIGVTKSNWDNAKKVLPRFAEQLGDVIRQKDGGYVIADAPGHASQGIVNESVTPRIAGEHRRSGARAPRASREVTGETIGRAGTAEQSDEVKIPSPEIDPDAVAAAITARAARLRRHNQLVRSVAARLETAGSQLFEDPFDILAILDSLGILIEVKTLDGSERDERDRVRDALGQLLYYEGFVTAPIAGETPIRKIACFDSPIKDAHRHWLNTHGIATIWKHDDIMTGDELARDYIGRVFEELWG